MFFVPNGVSIRLAAKPGGTWQDIQPEDWIMRNLRCLNLIFMLVFLATGLASNATLIDVAVTQASITTKTGFAATGVITNDFWNTDEMVTS